MSKKLKTPILQKYQRMYDKDRTSRVFAPLAETYRSLGMMDKAFEVLREGIKHNPDYVMGYLGLAGCYAEEGEWTNVYSTLRPFVNKNRDNLRLQKVFAKACLEINHFDEALETYKYILFLNPADKEAANAVLKLEDSTPSSQKNKKHHSHSRAEAEETFEVDNLEQESIFDEEVENWETVDFIAKKKEFADKKKESKPIEDWNVKRFDLESEQSFIKGFAHFDNDSTEMLEEDINKTPVITHTLVDLYCSQGHIEKAVEVLEKILELNPNDKKTQQKLSEIKELLIDDEEKNNSDYSVTEDVGQAPEEEGTTEEVYTEQEESDDHQRLLDEVDQRIRKDTKEKSQEVIYNLENFLAKIKKRSSSIRENFSKS